MIKVTKIDEDRYKVNNEDFWSVDAIADFLGVSKSSVFRHVLEKKYRFIRRRKKLFALNEVLNGLLKVKQ